MAEVARFRLVPLGSLSPVLAGYGQLAKPRWQAWRRRWQLADRTPEDVDDLLSEILAFCGSDPERKGHGRPVGSDHCVLDPSDGRVTRCALGGLQKSSVWGLAAPVVTQAHV